MRVVVRRGARGLGMCTSCSISTARSSAARRPSPSCSRTASAICAPTRVDRVERGHRLLEHDADLLAADRAASRVCAERHQIAALPQDLAGGDAPGRHRRSASAPTSRSRSCRSRTRRRRRASRRARPPDRRRRPHARCRRRCRNTFSARGYRAGAGRLPVPHHITLRGSSASRSPSPTKLIDSTAERSRAPGNSAQCGAMSR